MKSRNLIDSFNYAIEGLFYAFKTQRNMKIHFAAALLALIAASVIRVSRIEAIFLLIAITLVIGAEMFNTAIEVVVDMISIQYHPLAAIAKNVSAGAVLVTAVNALVTGYLIFYDRISNISNWVISGIDTVPVHVTIMSIFIVIIIVIIVKSFFDKGTFLRGGMPSGHSALAMSLFTSIMIISRNFLIAGLSAVMAMIVFHSRIESGIHSISEVIIGALLGMLTTIILFQLFIF